MNVVTGYQLQDGDVWNNVEKELNTTQDFFVRQVLRPANAAAQRVSLTLRDTWNSTQRWSPFDSYKFGGRWAALSTLSISNNYVLSDQRSNVTGTTSKTITQTLPDAVASISQLEKLWYTEGWMKNTQMNFKYSLRTTETVGATLEHRELLRHRHPLRHPEEIRHLDELQHGADVQQGPAGGRQHAGNAPPGRLRPGHAVRRAQVPPDAPKIAYTKDVTMLGSGIQSANTTVITPRVLARADLALPSGLRLPGSSRPLLFTNRIIWTTTLSLSHRESPVSPVDNSNLASLNTSADYELAKNLRMTLNGAATRNWSLDLPVNSFYSFTLGTTLRPSSSGGNRMTRPLAAACRTSVLALRRLPRQGRPAPPRSRTSALSRRRAGKRASQPLDRQVKARTRFIAPGDAAEVVILVETPRSDGLSETRLEVLSPRAEVLRVRRDWSDDVRPRLPGADAGGGSIRRGCAGHGPREDRLFLNKLPDAAKLVAALRPGTSRPWKPASARLGRARLCGPAGVRRAPATTWT